MNNTRKHTGGLSRIEKARLDLFYAHQYNYHTIVRERLNAFDADGAIELTNADGTRYRENGRKWINDHIRYFREKDNTPWYKMCAKLKDVLDEYDSKFERTP